MLCFCFHIFKIVIDVFQTLNAFGECFSFSVGSFTDSVFKSFCFVLNGFNKKINNFIDLFNLICCILGNLIIGGLKFSSVLVYLFHFKANIPQSCLYGCFLPHNEITVLT